MFYTFIGANAKNLRKSKDCFIHLQLPLKCLIVLMIYFQIKYKCILKREKPKKDYIK